LREALDAALAEGAEDAALEDFMVEANEVSSKIFERVS
jgi:hypothetical protein